MNPRVALLAWTLMFVVACYGLYRVKYQVLALRSEIAQTSHALEQERESLHAAAAEWAYLSRPDRLEQLNGKYLRLRPMQAIQAASLASLDAHLSRVRTQQGQIVPASAHPGDGE